MNAPHIIDMLPAYSLGILDEVELQQVQAHLAQCSLCREELAAYQEVVAQLPYAVTQINPPRGVKAGLFEQIRAEELPSPPGYWQAFKQFFIRFSPAWGVVSAVLLVTLIVTNLLLWRQIRERAVPPGEQFHVVQMASVDATHQGYGWMIMTPDGRYGTIIVEGLPDLATGMAYQVWLIRGDERVSGGMLSVSYNGYGAVEIRAPDALDQYERVGVTIEPAAGSPGPTGARVLTGDL